LPRLLPHFFAKKPRHPCEAWDSACYAYVFWLRIAIKFATNLRNRVFGGYRIEIDRLCEKCGYFFAAECSLVFNGNIKAAFDMLSTYQKYL